MTLLNLANELQPCGTFSGIKRNMVLADYVLVHKLGGHRQPSDLIVSHQRCGSELLKFSTGQVLHPSGAVRLSYEAR